LTIALTKINLNEDIDFAVTWIAISNSFWNVVIYSIMNRKFRYIARTYIISTRKPQHVWTISHHFQRMCLI
jgi:hypothetical protein